MWCNALKRYINHPIGTAPHYEWTRNGKVSTPAELREEWEACKEWGYTNECFECWLENLLRTGQIKAKF